MPAQFPSNAINMNIDNIQLSRLAGNDQYKFRGFSGNLYPDDNAQRDGWFWVVLDVEDHPSEISISKDAKVFASACMLRDGIPSAEGQNVYTTNIVPTDNKVYIRVGIDGGPAEYRVSILVLNDE
jgi:hypothetical protein